MKDVASNIPPSFDHSPSTPMIVHVKANDSYDVGLFMSTLEDTESDGVVGNDDDRMTHNSEFNSAASDTKRLWSWTGP